MRHAILIGGMVGVLVVRIVGAAEPLAPAAAPAARPEMRALRVPERLIQVDGSPDDWQRLGAAFPQAGRRADLPANLAFAYPDRGPWQGPTDLGVTVWTAVDTDRLYVLARVEDQLLFNDAAPDEVYLGDDFEVFVDANPPDAQFAAARNENARQFIFLPAWVNPARPQGEVWKAAENPGVTVASRLQPEGYMIEVSIPKALFPNWLAHPDLDGIGFDVMLGDADSPGMDGPHGSIKHSGFLLSPGNHFQTSEKLGRLVLGGKVTPVVDATPEMKDAILRSAGDLPARRDAVAGREAQRLLDRLGTAETAAQSGSWTLDRRADDITKTRLFALAKRPSLPAPTVALRELCTPPADGPGLPAELANYALVALAERKQIPGKEWFAFYDGATDPQIRLTWVWCLMVNGDPSVQPQLEGLLTDANLRVRVKAAMALGVLGDGACLAALEKMKTDDPHPYGRRAAEEAATAVAGRNGK